MCIHLRTCIGCSIAFFCLSRCLVKGWGWLLRVKNHTVDSGSIDCGLESVLGEFHRHLRGIIDYALNQTSLTKY